MMKSLTENIKLGILEAIASIFGILTIVFTFLPAFSETGFEELSLASIAFGNNRVDSNGLLIFGFVLLIIGLVASLIMTILLFLNKTNQVTTTVISIVSIVTTIIGAAILTPAIFISGLDTMTTELGFTQGVWRMKIGMFLTPIAALIAVGASYPSAMIILHHQDLKEGK